MLTIAFLTWAVNQGIKLTLFYMADKKWDWGRIFGAGGMPSTHSALSVSAAVSIGFLEGWDTSLFALAGVFAVIVMADAAGVRRATGEQAKILNKLILLFFKDARFKNERMEELIGHTPFEVIMGAIIGFLVATILSIYFAWQYS